MANGLSPSTLVGRCHVCRRTDREIQHCPLCDHWFCEQCDRDLAGRAWGAIEQLLKGRKQGCCGPHTVRQVTDAFCRALPIGLIHDPTLPDQEWTAVVGHERQNYYGYGSKISLAVKEALSHVPMPDV